MSALPPKADIERHDWHVRLVPKADFRIAADLFDHLVGGHEQCVGNCEAERLGRLQVDDKLEFGRLLKWRVAGFFAAEDAVDVAAARR